MSWPVPPHGFLGSQASTAAAPADNDTYQISRSLRFNSADSAFLSRTPASAGNRKTWTWSGWVKRSALSGTIQLIESAGTATSTETTRLYFGFGGTENFIIGYGGADWRATTQLFRDISSWYHIVVAFDSGNATALDRIKLYVNGSQITSFSTTNTVTLNTDGAINNNIEHFAGRDSAANQYYFNGYLTEINFIDGQALTPSSFGETDATTGRWKAKAYAGTYGTNGFYLPFTNQSTAQNIFTYSEDFSNAVWIKYQSTCVANSTTAPNGAPTADKLVINNGQTHGQFVTSFLATDNATYTASAYVKALDFDTGTIYMIKKNGTLGSIDFNLSTVSIGNAQQGATGTITAVGSGWYRVTITQNVLTGGTTNPSVYYHFNGTGDGVKGVYIWGAQLEASSSAGPYMYTGASAQTTALTVWQDSSVSAGGYNSWVSNNLSVTPGVGNDSLTDSPSNYGTISTTLVNDTYQISKSLRFNSADSAYLSRTPSVAGNRKTWTWSGWFKRGKVDTGTFYQLFGGGTGTGGNDGIFFDTTAGGVYYTHALSDSIVTTSGYRDPSAWYHIVFSVDTTQATASNRVRVYINGAEVRNFSTANYPAQNADNAYINTTSQHRIGAHTNSGYYFDGYLAEVNFVDGQALTPDSFGTRDINTYLWKPKAYTGTYGTNGFYLSFSNSSSATTRNLLTYSEDFANGSWTNYQSTETSNVAVAPNGTTTADKLIPDAGALGGQFYRNYSAVDNTTYTFSVYAKAAEYTQLRLYIQKKATSATYDFADYDLTSATVTATYGSPTSTSIVAVGNGWHRISISSNVGTGGTATPGVNIQHLGSAGNGSNGILLWGAQLEDSGTLGPYLRTDASATASTLRLGSDSSVSTGGYNSWFANNFSVSAGPGNDSLVDSPTYYGTDTGVGGEARGDYCTLDPFNNSGVLSNGNLEFQASTTTTRVALGTSKIIPSVKTYFEVNVVTAAGAGTWFQVGIVPSGKSLASSIGTVSGNGYSIEQEQANDMQLRLNGSTVAISTVVQTSDVLQVAVDHATGKLWFGRNNTWYNSSGGTTGNPSAGTNETATISTVIDWFPAVAKYNTGGSYAINFGQRPFAYTAPSGFRALRDYNKLPTPTGGEVRGNYCTLNPLDFSCPGTISNGNLQYVQSTLNPRGGRSTIAVSSGKWYWEVTNNGGNNSVGIIRDTGALTSYIGANADGWSYFIDGQKYNNGSATSYGASYTTNDVIGVALDMDARTLAFYKNGVSQGTAFSGLSGTMSPGFSSSSTTAVSFTVNFGQRPWAYDAPFGFKPLCTTLLPQPIVQKSSSYMDVVTYTGNGAASQDITSLSFSPDLVWLKSRTDAFDHRLKDSTRGNFALFSNLTNAQSAYTLDFLSNGIRPTLGFNDNISSKQYVAWAWDESPIAGLDIVSYVGDGNSGRAISHSLGVAPKFILVKNRSIVSDWPVYHASLAANNIVFLHLTQAQAAISTLAWGGVSAASSTTFTATVGNVDIRNVNKSGDNYIAYCFAEVEGFSKFGSYTGNGSADGPFVYCGFRPRWIMIKRSDSTGTWFLIDTSRNPSNIATIYLQADSSAIEGSDNVFDILSNGFKQRNAGASQNASGGTYIFAAFAESPFKYSRAR